ncbi:MAG TPA: polysaccharide deacetylase family protein [Beijerinckiaceae bacterium]|nr:polysaccharide deacetylase family protein [Beijerinckiaceae bacterium]
MTASSLTRFARRVRYAVAHPTAVVRYLVGTPAAPAMGATAVAEDAPPVELAQPDPLQPFERYLALGRAQGIEQPTLFLSFDCDTDLDFTAALEVKRFLDSLGIKATWAVPGVQIERGADTYRSIAATGAEFMNHGQLPHTAWGEDRYISITWYHEMTPEDVTADILAGDATIRRVLGVTPGGFRAPHFGHYAAPDQLALVHACARQLGYSYCSTTLPAYGLGNGPLHDADGIVELPTFGSLVAPTSVLDSWSYLTDRRVYQLGDVYAELMCATAERLVSERAAALLTWYADPSHVVGQAPFERAMQRLVSLGIPSLHGSEAAALLRRASPG